MLFCLFLLSLFLVFFFFLFLFPFALFVICTAFFFRCPAFVHILYVFPFCFTAALTCMCHPYGSIKSSLITARHPISIAASSFGMNLFDIYRASNRKKGREGEGITAWGMPHCFTSHTSFYLHLLYVHLTSFTSSHTFSFLYFTCLLFVHFRASFIIIPIQFSIAFVIRVLFQVVFYLVQQQLY